MLAARRVSPYVLLTLTPFFWSCNWIVGRGLASEIPPMAMAFFRWFFAIAILMPFAWPHFVRDWPRIRTHWKILVLLGAVGVCAHNVLVYVGLHYTTVTNGVILNSFIPVMIVAISWAFLRERLSVPQVAGIAVSLAGVFTIVSDGSLAKLLGFRLNSGDLLIILSLVMWSIYTIALRWRPEGLHVMSFLLAVAIAGDLCILPLWLGEMALGKFVYWSWANLAALLFIALFSAVLAYLFWNRGVAEVGASVAGLFVHLMPVFGVLLAWLFLGEGLAPYHVAGIALIMAGIWLTSRYGRSRRDVDRAAAVGTD